MGKDYYQILGVSRDASEADLKKAYRKLAMQWHPDKHPDPADKKKAEQKFKDISYAYDTLIDKDKRRQYDLHGEEGAKFQTGGGGVYNVDPSVIFAKFFSSDTLLGGKNVVFGGPGGGAFGMGNRMDAFDMNLPRIPGASVTETRPNQKELPLTLEDLYNGAVKTLKIARQRFKGNEAVKDEAILTVNVKKGWKDGTKINYKGYGDQAKPGAPPVDLELVVATKKHPSFVRMNNTLIYKHRLPLVKALCGGFTIPMNYLDGRTDEIVVNESVKPSSRKVIPNEGMPISKRLPQQGDLVIEFDIVFPERLTAEQKSNLKHILPSTEH